MKNIFILLADDDKDDRFFFDKALGSISLPSDFVAVEDGEKLMSWLRKAAKLPDVLFLDINMPRKNGAECLAEIKSDPVLKKIPRIVYSIPLRNDVPHVL